MRRLPALAALALVAACSSPGAVGAPTRTGPPTASAPGSPAASPTAAAQPSRHQVVVRSGKGVQLLAVDGRHRVRVVRKLAPPDPGSSRPEDVATASAASGLVCVTWAGAGAERAIACYEPGASSGRVVVRTRGPGFLALRADGRRIAWTERIEHPTYPTDNLVVAQLGATGVTALRRVTSDPERCPGECFQGCSPDALSWAGGDALLLTANCESDEGNPLRLLPLAELDKGWSQGASGVAPPEAERPYTKYDAGGTATSTTGYAVERGHAYGFDDEDLPERAVRLDLRTGAVLEVVATAQRDRYVASVSGSAGLLVYVTAAAFTEQGPSDPRFYARFAGEPHGTRLSGLPAGTVQVEAFA